MKQVTLLTIGYQGRGIDDYIQDIKKQKVKVLFDVRKNALSRKKGFSKNGLKSHCQEHNIVYIHLPNLGVDSAHRRNLNCEDDYNKLFEFYVKEILSNVEDDLNQIHEALEEHLKIAITCFENDASMCHRQHIAKRFENLESLKVEVKNL